MSGSTEVDANIKILESFQWNLERAVNSLLDENFGSSIDDPGRPGPSNASRIPARPAIPQEQTRPLPPPSTWAAFVTKPVYWSFRLLWKVINYTLSLLPFWSNNSDKRIKNGLSDRELSKAYQRDFDNKYGATGLEFFVGSYLQALDKAKADLKFLLVILQSDEHDDTEPFCKFYTV